MILKPQDVLVALKLALGGDRPWTYKELAEALGLSAGEAHNAVQRGVRSGLVAPDKQHARRQNLLEFLVHGVKYAFPAERGGLTRGVPTAHAAPPLAGLIAYSGPPPVWPDAEGSARGEALTPLYRSVAAASRKDERLYECLALVDAIRAGRSRERTLAEKHLRRLLEPVTSDR